MQVKLGRATPCSGSWALTTHWYDPMELIPRAQKPCFIPPNYLFSTPGDEYKQQGLYLSTESLCSLLYGTIALIEELSDSALKLQ